jgi:hypothetical protein
LITVADWGDVFPVRVAKKVLVNDWGVLECNGRVPGQCGGVVESAAVILLIW